MSSDVQPNKRDRQKARRAERLAAEQAARKKEASRRRVGLLVAGLIAIAAVVGIGYTLVQGVPDPTLGIEAAAIQGDPLPPADSAAGPDDPAVGLTAPTVTGQTVDGDEVVIGATGTPQAVVFMAHWCPVCQDEAPEIAQWVDEGLMAEGVELVAVSSRHDPARSAWPPDEWLDGAGFPGPVLIDGHDVVAEAWGLQGTPMWTFVDGDGTVVARYAGAIDDIRFAEGTALAAR